MVQLRVTAIPEVAIPWSSGFSRLTDRPADASLANGTKSAMAFSGWHARVLASMECRRGHAGRGYPADRVTPGLSMLTLRVSMAPVPVPVAGARRETIEQPKRASGRSFASVVTRKRPSLNRAGDFAGVLVSDFYSAYDSVTCHQQKCHLHLMRDINDDLLHNPFDEELKELARRYTLTLKPMVETIDKHGLKTKFLSKHKRNAEAFLNWIGKQEVTSDVAQGYKSRIEKYGERLFTFLDYDGVPWNNNNAENALKLVASRRRLFDIGLGGGSQGLSRLPEHLSNPETQGDQHAEVSALR